jgi:hypothetical protein
LSFTPRKAKVFDRPVPDRHHVVDHHRLEEALGLEVVRQIVGVEGWLMASRALALAEKDLLAAHLGLRRLGGIELAENIELGRRRKVQHLLKIGHEVDLAAALERVHPFLCGDHDIAVEIGRALLEFGEILDRLQRSLRSEQPLDVQAAQRNRFDAVAECCGRVSGAKCVAPFWWPFEWQSKQAEPILGSSERRSSVALNCCCGKALTAGATLLAAGE